MKDLYFIYEITPRCNNDCLYCYNVWKENNSYPAGELQLPQIKKLFAKLLSEVVPERITIAGGEPLLHPDILEVSSFLSSRNIKVGIATNGTLFKEETADRLIKCGVDYFEISLSSADPEVYAELSNNDKLSQIRNAILKVKKCGARIVVSFVATKQNLADLEEVIDLCFAFSADGLAINRFTYSGRGLKYKSRLKISLSELKNILETANEKSKKYNFPVSITIPVESCLIDHSHYPYLRFGGCSCGREKWVIDSVGNLRICEQNPRILGSLFDDSFYRLSNLDYVRKFKNDNLKEKCFKCDYFNMCRGGCRYTRDAL